MNDDYCRYMKQVTRRYTQCSNLARQDVKAYKNLGDKGLST